MYNLDRAYQQKQTINTTIGVPSVVLINDPISLTNKVFISKFWFILRLINLL